MIQLTNLPIPFAADGYVLRGFRDDADYERLPFKGSYMPRFICPIAPLSSCANTHNLDAWSFHRAELLNIFARRVPHPNVHLGKRLVKYYDLCDHLSSSTSPSSFLAYNL